MTIKDQVILELRQLKKLGLPARRLDKGIQYAQDNETEIEDLRENGGMRISDIADLVCDLASI